MALPAPSLHPLLLSLVLFAHLPFGSSTKLAADSDSLNHERCTFERDGYAFDLCPLFNDIVRLDTGLFRGGDSGLYRRAYEISLAGSSKGIGVSGDSGKMVDRRVQSNGVTDLACPEGTWICRSDEVVESAYPADKDGLSTSSPRSTTVAVIAGEGFSSVEAVMTPSCADAAQSASQEDPRLSLFFHRRKGSLGGPRSTRIDLVCDRHSQSSTSLKLHSDTEENLAFEWQTPHACPRASLEESPIMTIEEEEGSDNGGEEEEKDGDALTPQRESRLSRRWIACFLLVFGLIAIGASIIASSQRVRHVILDKLYSFFLTITPTLSLLVGKLRPIKRMLAALTPSSIYQFRTTFRQGDSQLVRWAQEDMSLEEDFMVNGRRDVDLENDGWNGEGLDEYIPLTISPGKWGKGRQIQTYGAASLPSSPASGFTDRKGGTGQYWWK